MYSKSFYLTEMTGETEEIYKSINKLINLINK